jgi:hypothetical protein
MFNIMLKHVQVLAPHELENCIVAIRAAAEYSMFLALELGNYECLSVIERMLNGRMSFWTGVKLSNGETSSHSPETYTWLVAKVQQSLFPALVAQLEADPWVGCEKAAYILPTLAAVSRLKDEAYTPDMLQAHARMCIDRLMALSDAAMKAESHHLKKLLAVLPRAFPTESEEPDRMRLQVFMHCLLCQSLPLRIFGLNSINEMCRSANDAESSTVSAKTLATWLQSDDIRILPTLVGDRVHPQLLKLSEPIMNMLAQQHVVTADDVIMMWKASIGGTHTSIADGISALIAALCLYAPPPRLKTLCAWWTRFDR